MGLIVGAALDLTLAANTARVPMTEVVGSTMLAVSGAMDLGRSLSRLPASPTHWRFSCPSSS
jgi:hypothetical protein